MKRKYKESELEGMDVVEIYKLILAGRTYRFPKGTWDSEDARDNAKACVKYLFEEIHGFKEEDMLKIHPFIDLFRKSKLMSMYNVVYHCNVFECVNDQYPNKFNVWDFQVPNDHWHVKQNRIDAVRYVVEKMKKNGEPITEFKYDRLRAEGLVTIINTVSPSVYELLNEAYPDVYRPWDLSSIPRNYWKNKDNRMDAIDWLIDKLDIDSVNKLTNRKFKDNGLEHLTTLYNITYLKKEYKECKNILTA